MAKSEVKWGALLSYVLIFFSSIYGLVLMPFILGTIGQSEYGVYKTIASMTATVSIMEFGIGGALQKFLSQYRAQKEEKKAQNLSAMCLIQSGVLAAAMLIICVLLFFSINSIYDSSFTPAELIRAKQVFVIFSAYVVLHIFENVLFGLIAGYNRFIFSNTLKLCSLAVKILVLFLLLPIFNNALFLVFVSLCLEITVILVEYLYIKAVLKHKIKLYFWDKVIFKDTFFYMALLFVQSILIQLNGNIDNIIIGALIGTSAVTVYSFAIQIFNMYEHCSTAISGVILPTITNLIFNGAEPAELKNQIVKFGRAQWSVLGAALGGFICVGKEFFSLWLGNGYEDCYYLSLILMIPVTFPLVTNTCLAILKAKNLLKFRTLSLAYAGVLNLIISIIGTRYWGYWGAAVGTAISTIVSSVISLNIYYRVKLKIKIVRVYCEIFHRITLCILVPCVCILFLNPHFSGTWMTFILKVAIFILIYGILMLLLGLTKKEKQSFFRRKRA